MFKLKKFWNKSELGFHRCLCRLWLLKNEIIKTPFAKSYHLELSDGHQESRSNSLLSPHEILSK